MTSFLFSMQKCHDFYVDPIVPGTTGLGTLIIMTLWAMASTRTIAVVFHTVTVLGASVTANLARGEVGPTGGSLTCIDTGKHLCPPG